MKDTKKNNKSALLWEFLRGSRRWFIASILAGALVALADMLIPQVIRAAVDCAIGGQEGDFPGFVMNLVNRLGGFAYLGRHLWIMALGIGILAVVQVACQYLHRVCNARGAETLVKTMRDRLYTHIQRLPFSWHSQIRTGDIIQRCTSDIDTTKRFLSEQMTSIFRIVILLVLSITFMLSMHPTLTLIALIPMPVILLYSLLFHGKIHKGFSDCDENEGKLSAIAQENLTGVRVVRAFGRERAEVEKFAKQNDHYTKLWEKMAGIMSQFWITSDILSGIQVMLVVVWGAWFCIQGSMLAGAYIAFISYNNLLVWPIRQLGRMISELSKATVSLDRIAFILDTPVEADAPDATDAPRDGDIVFENVGFAYENGPQILEDISFTLKSGTTLGILGGTGSGKSTLMLLLDKLYAPTSGRITIGGRDIQQIRTAHLRQNIGMVLQEPFLFSRTIGENIAIATDAQQDAIRQAAQAACLDETVMGFAQGYETLVGERGVTLSGGQKQRTAIARMLIRESPIMVFDDSLSAVDTETDEKIRAAIAQRFGKSTVILISHRITTLAAADQILVLDKGHIAESGTHDQLRCAGGIYQRIYESQSADQEVSL